LTIKDFLHEAAEYYGAYNPTVAKYVLKWLEKHNFDSEDMATLWAEILKAVSSSFKAPPDVAALEAAYKAMLSRDDRRLDRRRYLPAPTETVDRSIALDFVSTLLESIQRGEDPRGNPKLIEIVTKATE
jgi:hypothetical protein